MLAYLGDWMRHKLHQQLSVLLKYTFIMLGFRTTEKMIYIQLNHLGQMDILSFIN